MTMFKTLPVPTLSYKNTYIQEAQMNKIEDILCDCPPKKTWQA